MQRALSCAIRERFVFAVTAALYLALGRMEFACGAPLADRNGDGVVSILAFGDSITYGVGDDLAAGSYVEEVPELGAARGCPKRLSGLVSAAVSNAGEPGERLTQSGWARLPGLVVGSDVDTVILMEGTNDAIHRTEGAEYRRKVQRLINVVRAEGRSMVLATLPPPVANQQSLSLFTNLYSAIIRELSVVNSLPYADVEQKFISDCPELQSCPLYNIPEGLHPNTTGYDAIADVMRTTLEGGEK
jgi:lysophospholipase L1-like esterase